MRRIEGRPKNFKQNSYEKKQLDVIFFYLYVYVKKNYDNNNNKEPDVHKHKSKKDSALRYLS